MGWFSTKKKTEVYTSATRMIEDKDLINSNKAAVTEYLLRNSLQTSTSLKEESIVDYMIQASAHSLPAKWGRAYREAAKGRYTYGLPRSDVVLRESTSFLPELREVLDSIAGTPVSIIYGHVDEMNYSHIAFQKLSSTYGFVPETNELTVLSAWTGFPAYLHDMELFFPSSFITDVVDESYFTQWNYPATGGATPSRVKDYSRPHTPADEDPEAVKPYAKVTYTYREAGVDKYLTLTFDFDGYDDSDDYIMACYSYAGKIRYFTGHFGTGEFPGIEAAFTTSQQFGQFYPRMYGRLNKTNLAADALKNTEDYKNCQKFWRNVDLDWSEWVNQLHESLDSQGDIAQAYVQCSVPANSRDPDVIEYLHKFFLRLSKAHSGGISLRINDAVYAQSLAISSIKVRTKAGSIGPKGTYRMVLEADIEDSWSNLSGSRVFTKFLAGFGRKAHKYRYQITDSSYREVVVHGLSVSEYVQGGYRTNSSGDSETLLIPMDYSMAKEMSSRDFEQVMLKSLHVIVNTVVVVKTKWYQRGAFKVVMFIAAVVFSLFTAGAGFGLLAITAAVVQAVALTIVITLVTKLAVALGVSVEIMAAIAVVAALVTGYVQFTKAAEIAGMSAKTVMMASNVALGVQSKMRMLEIQSIQKAFKNMEEDFKGRMEELEAIESDFWDDRQILDNMLWVQPNTHGVFINLGESPDDYYTRTIHTGNVGVAVLDITLDSVENMLKLPTPSHTFEMLQGGSL